jgi:methionyl-tRNA synthetase
MVFGQDAQFSDEAFVDRFNSDLANDLGNTVSRVVTLSRRAFSGRTPPESCDDNPLIRVARKAVEDYRRSMDEMAFDRALKSLWGLLAETNQYFVAKEPWRLIKSTDESGALSRVLWNGLEAVRIVATALYPCMPKLAPQVLRAVGTASLPEDFSGLSWGLTPTGVELPEPVALFPRIDKKKFLEGTTEDGGREVKVETEQGGVDANLKQESSGAADEESQPKRVSISDFFKTELRVATVITAEAIPKSSKLLKLQVDLGGETRTLVAGIAKSHAPEDVVGKQIVIVANLDPAKLMGVESQGMVLAASIDGRAVLLQPAEAVPDGSPVK